MPLVARSGLYVSVYFLIFLFYMLYVCLVYFFFYLLQVQQLAIHCAFLFLSVWFVVPVKHFKRKNEQTSTLVRWTSVKAHEGNAQADTFLILDSEREASRHGGLFLVMFSSETWH